MTVEIEVDGVDYEVPSSAADTNWAALQVAFEQALAALANGTATDLTDLTATVTAMQGDRVKVLSKNITPVGTGADTTEDNLMTYTLPGGTLSANGKSIRVTACGTGVSTADVTTLRAYFGATAVVTKVLEASQANFWRVVFEVSRTGAATQICTGLIANGGTVNTTAAGVAAGSETLSGNVTVKLTGQRTSSSVADSIRQLLMVVELLP